MSKEYYGASIIDFLDVLVAQAMLNRRYRGLIDLYGSGPVGSPQKIKKIPYLRLVRGVGG